MRFLLFLLCVLPFSATRGQLIYTEPVFPTAADEVTVYFDATQGNQGLMDCGCTVYVHTGVITNLSSGPSDWKHVQTTWGQSNVAWAMTPVPGEPNKFSWTITPDITTYYGVPGGEVVEQLAFVFRNAAGDKTGKDVGNADIFTPVYDAGAGFLSAIVAPTAPSLLLSSGQQQPIKVATNHPATLSLYDNGSLLTQTTGTSLEYNLTASGSGTHTVTFEATETSSGNVLTKSFNYVIPVATIVQDPPAGTKLGANYISDSEVILSLYAPDKDFVFVVGDHSGWLPDTEYQMNRSVDGNRWWLQLSGLTPGEHYRYQYLVSGGIAVADPLSEVVLSQWDDGGIPAVTYPDLPAFPSGQAVGNVSLLRPGHPAFSWQNDGYERPKKTDLVIYELLLRDFLHRHDFETLKDTLDYLERLGVNAIQLMPVNEFEGNESWGYNPSFHMAIDKYYGTTDALKELIDEAHSRGMAVIADVVFNHAFGQSPLVNLYWNSATGSPSADNPWLNSVATHPYNVGYDFNHESLATKEYVKRCVGFWITEYHFDGFRFDLSKGFTQVNSGDNVGQWGQYDQSRINIWKDYADYIWSLDPENYVILEHFADNSEEKVLAEYGMMLWANNNYKFRNAAAGKTDNDFNGLNYKNKNWAVPHAIGYQESHDEERVAYECVKNGANFDTYFIKDTATAMRRIELSNVLFYTVPGPKMLWEFGELGYHFCINYCKNTAQCNNCRLDNKPIRWDFYQQADRRRSYEVARAMMHLKTTYDIFETTDFSMSASGFPKAIRLKSDTMNVVALGNFDTKPLGINPVFPHTGWWYEYFTGDSIEVANATDYIQLLQGEYRLYFDRAMPAPPGGYIDYILGTDNVTITPDVAMSVAPNPSYTGSTTVRYQMQRPAQVRLQIFDALGRQLHTLTDGRQGIGSYEFETPSLPAGQYLIRLDVDGQATVRQFIVIQ